MNSNYTNQDRGDEKEYKRYLEAMDAISIEKIASASVFFEPNAGNTIVDIGMASGTSTAILAQLFPNLHIIGVDINPTMVNIAKETYQSPNLIFREDDGEKLSSFTENSIDGFFNCSAIHHITSYNGYNSNKAVNTLRRQVELLKEDGILIVRDFVKPMEQEVFLYLSTLPEKDRPSDVDLFSQFANTARSLSPITEQGFPYTEERSDIENFRKFQLFYSDAVEFIRRKDYYANWEIELQEEYGYFTQQEFEDTFRELGLRIIHSAPIYNQWIIDNRYKGKFVLKDLKGNDIGFPATNYIIVGKKVSGGKEIKLTRHLPQLEKSFLQYNSYQNIQTKEIYDVVQRPNEVYDILPYHKDNNKISILAKSSYPRPIVNIETDSTCLDGKRNSGYINELLSVTTNTNIEEGISKRYGIDNYEKISPALHYYTSPGGINEKVSSYFVCLNNKTNTGKKLKDDSYGFQTKGTLQTYDATQLLNTAQTGALLEARLEVNIYHLFQILQIPLPQWLGQKITIIEVSKIKVSSLQDLLKLHSSVYIASKQCANFLQTNRAYFTEIGEENSNNILEYVYPKELSSNTLVTIPICKKENRVYIGLEIQELPVPQIYSNNSTLITAPAIRLSKGIRSVHELEEFLKHMHISDAQIISFSKLGEKYYPSVGITTEQVYPYVVSLDHCSSDLYWVALDELYTKSNEIEDAHLLIAIHRLNHALRSSVVL